MDALKKEGSQPKQPDIGRPQSRAARDAERGADDQEFPGDIGAEPGACARQHDRFRRITGFNMTVGTIHKTTGGEKRTMKRAGRADSQTAELRLALAVMSEEGREGAGEQPEQVVWFLQSVAPRYRYHGEAEVRMIIDGEQVGVGTAYALGGATMMSETVERLRLRVPAELFARVVKGRDVEVQIGATEFRLSPNTQRALREFAACVNLK